MTEPIDVVRGSWGWTGIRAEEVTAVSRFGHLMIRDEAGAFWYLDPELRTLEKVAEDDAGLQAFWARDDVRQVWQALALLDAARSRLGEAGPGRCYSLKIPALLAGDYAPENLCTYPIEELIGVTGDIAKQMIGLPDGAKVRLTVTD